MIRLIFAAVVLSALVSCNQKGPEVVLPKIQILDSLYMANAVLMKDISANEIVKYSEKEIIFTGALLEHYSDAEELEKWLFEGAKAGRTCGEFEKAVAYFKEYLERYPQGDKVAEANFLLGFIYDEDLNDKTRAKKYYEIVIRKHSKHELADDAEALLTQLYMSDEEILQMLQDKAKEMEVAS